MAEQWFVETLDGTIAGPFHERQISSDLISGKIPADLRVRQGESGAWCRGSRVLEIFRELAETGWYIRSDENEFGPFTPDRLMELQRAGEIEHHTQLRQGTKGTWKVANKIIPLWRPQRSSAIKRTDLHAPDQDITQSKWSVEPIRHYSLPLEIAFHPVVQQCAPNERLMLRESESVKEKRLAVVRSNERDLLGYFNAANSSQLAVNSLRGISHIALFTPNVSGVEIAIILCPAGTRNEDCRNYIGQNFAGVKNQ